MDEEDVKDILGVVVGGAALVAGVGVGLGLVAGAFGAGPLAPLVLAHPGVRKMIKDGTNNAIGMGVQEIPRLLER